MNLLSLNSNGLDLGDFKSSWIANIIKTHKIGVVGIQEIKRKFLSDVLIKRIWGSHDYDFVCSVSIGQGGGLVSTWNSNLFVKEQAISRKDYIVLQGTWKENDKKNVYSQCVH